MNKIKKVIKLRKTRVTKKIKAISALPRLVVFKSLKYDYVQIIDDVKCVTLASKSTQSISGASKREKAQKLGVEIAKILNNKKINKVVFDRRGYKYHGRIKIIVETIRKNSIKV